ncbi:hypothetical protein HanRHA438_Chr13g0586061 [Helianthus annuus]|nr:hypothetical protein HanIR_Chr13g0626081 [Helianthus annuus]KAJ0848143.1 hypothetical protein HanPSC8_Chr13g0553721 [Helianthus annuus]KAJ0857092.1 hypothetical protein HanRHA438_Chr13g0586061 [Helianthus annuus]
MPDGVLINGRGPFKYSSVVPDGINHTTLNVDPGVAILHYSNSEGHASGPLPDAPNEVYDRSFALNQAMSIRGLLNQRRHKRKLRAFHFMDKLQI